MTEGSAPVYNAPYLKAEEGRKQVEERVRQEREEKRGSATDGRLLESSSNIVTMSFGGRYELKRLLAPRQARCPPLPEYTDLYVCGSGRTVILRFRLCPASRASLQAFRLSQPSLAGLTYYQWIPK
jgi:hypothetical protein